MEGDGWNNISANDPKLTAGGSHHIFRRKDVVERINFQKDGTIAKAYQVKQVRNILLKYKLRSK